MQSLLTKSREDDKDRNHSAPRHPSPSLRARASCERSNTHTRTHLHVHTFRHSQSHGPNVHARAHIAHTTQHMRRGSKKGVSGGGRPPPPRVCQRARGGDRVSETGNVQCILWKGRHSPFHRSNCPSCSFFARAFEKDRCKRRVEGVEEPWAKGWFNPTRCWTLSKLLFSSGNFRRRVRGVVICATLRDDRGWFFRGGWRFRRKRGTFTGLVVGSWLDSQNSVN